MCKFIGKSNERILCNLSKSEILRLYSIAHVAMETTKTSHFTHQSKSFIGIFFTCQVSACVLRPFSCHDWQMTYTYKLPKLCSATKTPCSGSPTVYHPCLTGQSGWGEIQNTLLVFFESMGNPKQGCRRSFTDVTSQD